MRDQEVGKTAPVAHVDPKPQAAAAHGAAPAGHATEPPRSQASSAAAQRTQRSGSGTTASAPVAEHVSVSHEEEDERPGGATAFLKSFQARDDDDAAPAPSGGEGQTVVRSDGTVVTRRNGHVITEEPDGKRVDESANASDGSSTREVTYEQDGAQVTETTVTAQDGDVRQVSEVTKDGRIERTTSTTTLVDQPIEEVAPGLRDNLDLEYRLPEGATRDKAQEIHVVSEVVDTTKQPPETRKVLESTGYRQRVPVFGEGGEPQIAPPTTANPMLGSARGDGIVADVDRDASGMTLATTRTTTYDAQGVAKTTEQQGVTSILTGHAEDGREVTLSDATAVTLEAGRRTERVHVEEQRGVYPPGMMEMSGAGLKDEYRDRLEGDRVNHRSVETQKYEGDEAKTISRVDEFGDYDDPSKPGRVVRSTQEGDRKYWEYRLVTGTDQGIRVQDQVTVEGSKGKIVTDSTLNHDGTYHTLSQTYDDGVVIVRDERERRRISSTELSGADWHGDPAYRDRFVEEHGDRPLYEDSVLQVDMRDDPKARAFKTRSITAEGSGDRLTHVFLSREGGQPVGSNLTVLEDAQAKKALMRGDDGLEASIDSGQAVVEANGKRYEMAVVGGSLDPLGTADGGKSAFNNFYKVLSNCSESVPELHGGFKGAFGGLDVLRGGIILSQADSAGDVAGGVGNLTSGLGTISEMAGKAVSSTRLATLLGTGGKALGAVGALGGAIYGGYQIAEGDTVGGLFSMASAAGTGLAIGASIAAPSSALPVAGWVVAGVAIVGGLGYDLWKSNEEAHHTEALEF